MSGNFDREGMLATILVWECMTIDVRERMAVASALTRATNVLFDRIQELEASIAEYEKLADKPQEISSALNVQRPTT